MVTGASSAEAAVVLIDARKGVLTQTRRHSYLARLMGIRRFALAVTKMDLVDYDQAAFAAISDDYRRFADQIGITDWTAIPVSGLGGDNVAARSSAMLWHDGPTLLDYLNTVPLDAAADAAKPFRMPVQWVNRPEPGLPRVRRTDRVGSVAAGAEVRILPSGRVTRVERIVTADGDLGEAFAGQSVTLTLADAVDCSRGDVIAAAADPPQSADQFEADDRVDGRGRAASRAAAIGSSSATQTVTATVQHPKYEINVNTLEHLAAPTPRAQCDRRGAGHDGPGNHVRAVRSRRIEPQPRAWAASSSSTS